MSGFGIGDIISGVGSIAGLFGDSGQGDINNALHQAQAQYQDTRDTNRMVAGQQLALQDPYYQSTFHAFNNYLRSLGQDYITSDLVGSNIQHQGDNYVGVNADGSTFFASQLPQGTGGSQQQSGQGGTLSSLLGGTQQQGGGQSGGTSGWNPNAAMGTPVGTANGVTYYRRDQNSLMPYTWAHGSGQPQGPDLSAAAYQQSPGYQFQMDQGIQALDRSGAARGMTASGAQMQALNRFGQGVANQDFNGWADRQQQRYDNNLSRLGQLAGQAPVAAGQVGNVYSGLGASQAQNGGNLASLALTGGATNAQLAQNRTSAFRNGLNSIGTALGGMSGW